MTGARQHPMSQPEAEAYPSSCQFCRDIPGKPGMEMVRSDRKSPGVVITDGKRPGPCAAGPAGRRDGGDRPPDAVPPDPACRRMTGAPEGRISHQHHLMSRYRGTVKDCVTFGTG